MRGDDVWLCQTSKRSLLSVPPYAHFCSLAKKIHRAAGCFAANTTIKERGKDAMHLLIPKISQYMNPCVPGKGDLEGFRPTGR